MGRHIVLTTDLSRGAERAFAPVATLARLIGARVTLLHVVEDIPAIPHGAPMAAPLPSPEMGPRTAAAAAQLQEIQRRFPAGVVVDTAVEPGADVAATVAGFAERHGADFIAMASHGRSGLRRLVLGSVAEGILRHATRPVLVYPPDRNARED